MSEQAPESTATESANAPVQPAAGSAELGTSQNSGDEVRLSRQEYDSLTRNKDRVKGMQPYYEAGSQLGFKSPDDFGKWAPLVSRIAELGHDPQTVAEMFGPKGGAQQHTGEPEEVDIEALLDQKLTARDRERAEKAHFAALEQHNKLIEGWAKEAAGEGADEEQVSAYKWMARGLLEDSRSQMNYPDDHPLHGQFNGVLDQSGWEALTPKLKGAMDRLVGKSMTTIADAASQSRSKVTQTVGDGSGQGKTQTKPVTQEDFMASIREKAAKAAKSTMG